MVKQAKQLFDLYMHTKRRKSQHEYSSKLIMFMNISIIKFIIGYRWRKKTQTKLTKNVAE